MVPGEVDGTGTDHGGDVWLIPLPPGVRCSFCSSYVPRLRIECNPIDDYTQIFRFFCNANCLAKWGTAQPRPLPEIKAGLFG